MPPVTHPRATRSSRAQAVAACARPATSMAGGESSDDDDMPSLLDQTSDGESDDGGGGKKSKPKSKTKSKSKSKLKTKTPGSPVQVEESPEAKAQRLLETEATDAFEGILADAARTEDSEVLKKGIAAAKGLECALPAHRTFPTHLPPHISSSPCAAMTRHSLLRRAKVALRLAQRNGKVPQDALNHHLTHLQEVGTALESRLPALIQAEKENKRLLAEQKEQDRKEKEIARKKAPARRAPPIPTSIATTHCPSIIDPRRRARCSVAGCCGSQEKEGQGEARRGGAAPL